MFDQAVLDPDRGRAFDPWRTWREIAGPIGTVAAAILAANPHNSQPWVFRVHESSVDIYADMSRHTGVLDPLLRELRIGLGCALENLEIAARALGYAPTVALFPQGPDDALVAHVALDDGLAHPSALYEAIGRRHTNRGPFRATRVPDEDLDKLVDTTGVGALEVKWVTDPTAMTAMGVLMVDAATAITRDSDQSRESFAWFRSSHDAIQQHRDGLTLDAQGMSPMMLTGRPPVRLTSEM